MDDAVQAEAGAKAAVEADKAAVETAQVNLDFTRITAPVDGIAGTASWRRLGIWFRCRGRC